MQKSKKKVLSKEEKIQATKALADEIRRKGGVEWRSAVAGEDRVEFFRGKDFYRFFKAKPEMMAGIVDPDKTLEQQVEELCLIMLEQKVVYRCDRFYKKPHPGRKHLVKFPRKLATLPQDKQHWDPESFYCYLSERPTPAWQHGLSLLLAALVLAACLFPLAPYWVRISVVYFFLALLGLIFGILLIRALIFAAVFVLTGYELWLFPNLISDQVDFLEAFIPVVTFEKPADGKSHLASRAASFLGVATLVYVLYMYSPDEKGLATEVQKAHDSILDMLNLNPNGPSITSGEEKLRPPPQFEQMDAEKVRERLNNERRQKRFRDSKMPHM